MTAITRRYELDMGHCLPDHDGKCYRPHGHRYVVEATVEGELVTRGAETGMVMDFGTLRNHMAALLDPWDHMFAMDASDPRFDDAHTAFGDGIMATAVPPTVENLAELWGSLLAVAVAPLQLVRLRVYETPNCWADWEMWVTLRSGVEDEVDVAPRPYFDAGTETWSDDQGRITGAT